MAGYGKLQIGSVTLANNIILGPMAGVSDLPFRVLCSEMGAGLVCMETLYPQVSEQDHETAPEPVRYHP